MKLTPRFFVYLSICCLLLANLGLHAQTSCMGPGMISIVPDSDSVIEVNADNTVYTVSCDATFTLSSDGLTNEVLTSQVDPGIIILLYNGQPTSSDPNNDSANLFSGVPDVSTNWFLINNGTFSLDYLGTATVTLVPAINPNVAAFLLDSDCSGIDPSATYITITTQCDDCQVGGACDDMDANTENDVFDDNCNCVGQPIATCTEGDPCDDMDANTENDVFDEDCNCSGQPIMEDCDVPVVITETSFFCNEDTGEFTYTWLITGGLPDSDPTETYTLNGSGVNDLTVFPGQEIPLTYADGNTIDISATDSAGCMATWTSNGPVACIKMCNQDITLEMVSMECNSDNTMVDFVFNFGGGEPSVDPDATYLVTSSSFADMNVGLGEFSISFPVGSTASFNLDDDEGCTAEWTSSGVLSCETTDCPDPISFMQGAVFCNEDTGELTYTWVLSGGDGNYFVSGLAGEFTSPNIYAATFPSESIVSLTFEDGSDCPPVELTFTAITCEIATSDVQVSCPADVTIECTEDESSANTGMATGTTSDNCGDVSITENSTEEEMCGNTKVITRTWIATDDCGNTASCIQTITVVDTTDPVITCPADITIECGEDESSLNTGIATGADTCGPWTITESDTEVPGCGNTKVISRTWLVTDECGRTTSCVQTITVGTSENGVFNAACNCVDPPIFDCPDIAANIGDSCDDGNNTTENDVVNQNCECAGVSIFDCPALSANIGDSCDDANGNTNDDVITANCECAGVSVCTGSDLVILDQQDCDNATGDYTIFVVFDGGLPSIDPAAVYTVTGDINGSYSAAQAAQGLTIVIGNNDSFSINVTDGTECQASLNVAPVNCIKLSIELTDFYGEVRVSNNTLFWTTASETDNDYFAVERSSNGAQFESIGIVDGQMNSTIQTDYVFNDEAPLDGANFYRLRAVDAFGVSEFSTVILLNRESISAVSEVTVYPNPINDVLNLASPEADAKITIFHTDGRMLYRALSIEGNQQIDLSHLPAGLFYLKVVGETFEYTDRIIKQ